MRTLTILIACVMAAPVSAGGGLAVSWVQTGLVTVRNDSPGFEVAAPVTWTRLRTGADDPAAVVKKGALPFAVAPGNEVEDVSLPWNAVVFNAADPFAGPPPGPYVDLVVHRRTEAEVGDFAAALERLMAETFRTPFVRVNRQFKTAGGTGFDYAHVFAGRSMRWVILFGNGKQAVLKADVGPGPAPEDEAQVESVVQSIRLR